MDGKAETVGRRKTMIGNSIGYCVYIAMDCHYDQFCDGCPFRKRWERKNRREGRKDNG